MRNGYKQQIDLLNSLLLNIEMLVHLMMYHSCINSSYVELHKCFLAVEQKGKGAQHPSKLTRAQYPGTILPVYQAPLGRPPKTCRSLFPYRQELARYSATWKLIAYQTPNSCFRCNQLLNFCTLAAPTKSDLGKFGLLGSLFRNCGVHQACGNGC